MQPTGTMGSEAKLNAYVPIDDEHMLQWECYVSMQDATARTGDPNAKWLPNASGRYGRWNIEQNAGNDYLMDREAQRTWKSYTVSRASASRMLPSRRAWGRSTIAPGSTWVLRMADNPHATAAHRGGPCIRRARRYSTRRRNPTVYRVRFRRGDPAPQRRLVGASAITGNGFTQAWSPFFGEVPVVPSVPLGPR